MALDAEQLANAGVIAATGRQLGIGERGVVVALATAAQESRLRNLDYGDADSVGLFQQRPSQGWGQVTELMRPDYAATKFYEALAARARLGAAAGDRGGPGGATLRVPDRIRPLGNPRRRLGRPYRRSGTLPVRWSTRSGRCSPTPPVSATGLPRGNPRSVTEAIGWARAQAASGSGGWYRRCLAFVAQAYGWSFSGTAYAIDQYTAVMPTQLRHDGDRNPPPGALLFWSTGSRAGHVALYVGGGMVASNDIEVDGQISIVPAS